MRFGNRRLVSYVHTATSPAQEYEVKALYSSRVISGEDGSILVEAGSREPVDWFLRHANKTDGSNGHSTLPPTKRRKLTTSDETVTQPSLELIPLQTVKLDLHCGQVPNVPKAEPTRTTVADVVLKDVGGDGESLQLQAVGDRHKILVLDIEKVSASIQALLTDFVNHLPPGYSSRDDRPASFVQCSLVSTTAQSYTKICLQATLFWRSGVSGFSRVFPKANRRKHLELDLLRRVFHHEHHNASSEGAWKPSDFYDSIAAPTSHVERFDGAIDLLDTELYPFQRRAVTWMLQREGKRVEKDRLLPAAHDTQESYYQKFKDADGKTCYVSLLFCVVTRDKPRLPAPFSGGLLADEMGLGKTVELIALLCLNRAPDREHDPSLALLAGTGITQSRATLVVTPKSILQQWITEFQKHAPRLRIMIYEGVSPPSKSSKSENEMIREMAEDYDVVLVTYNILAKELHFTKEPPQRNMRHAKKFERKRSPLVSIRWWRICLDEAQMVESGVTSAAQVVQRLPRVHAWAVSGTPLRKNIQDLHGLLIFLRLYPFCDEINIWNYFVANHLQLFRQLWKSIGIRHSKAQVYEELRLPPQRRFVLTMPFTAVEQQHYSTMFSEMCQDVGLKEDGSPAVEDWNLDQYTETMRTWLVRLRQTCLHPQVGGRNRQALGRGRQGPLRTVGEVLEVMIEQNAGVLRAEERNYLHTRLKHAHIRGNDKSNPHRSEKALEIYRAVLESTEGLVKEARQRLAEVIAELQSKANSIPASTDEDSETEAKNTIGRFRGQLRTALQLRHTCLFFAATSCFQIKVNDTLTTPDSDDFKNLEAQETAMYDEAKTVRREILRDISNRAESLMNQIVVMMKTDQMVHIPRIDLLKSVGGIENRRIVEKSDELFEVIDDVRGVIIDWRQKMAERLSKTLVDEDEGMETTGEEYEQSTKQQDELYAYFDCVKAVQADLNTLITGESAPLIDHEVKVMFRDANAMLDPDNEPLRVVHAPELLIKLLEVRGQFRTRIPAVGSIRGLIQEARVLDGGLQVHGSHRSEGERTLVQQHTKALQKVFGTYTKVLRDLEKELDLFRNTQNSRLEFYRQLQELSDDVAPYKEELDETLDVLLLEAVVKKEHQHSMTIAQLKTKHRFLLHLQNESVDPSSARMCVICQCPFENGVLTVCGHQYCQECIHLWWSEHRTCPVCKRRLRTADLNNVTYKPQELRAKEENQMNHNLTHEGIASSDKPAAASTRIYHDVDNRIMDEIKSIDLPRSYGTKIDTLGRHLHWIRQNDAGTKSIVFSQFREFLDVLGSALTEFKLRPVRLGQGDAVQRFRHDPSIDCLLIDAKTDSSGLTLVNATNVFICEPLIHTAVELQAIARVHRIGQTRPTTVWMYLIRDTVEEAIYDLSVARRLSHVRSHQRPPMSDHDRKPIDVESLSTPNIAASRTPASTLHEPELEAADAAVLQSAPLAKFLTPGRAGGEIVEKDDLWPCLFGNAASSSTTTTTHRNILTRPVGFASSAIDGDDGDDDDDYRDATSGRAVTEHVDRFLRAEAVDRRNSRAD